MALEIFYDSNATLVEERAVSTLLTSFEVAESGDANRLTNGWDFSGSLLVQPSVLLEDVGIYALSVVHGEESVIVAGLCGHNQTWLKKFDLQTGKVQQDCLVREGGSASLAQSFL